MRRSSIYLDNNATTQPAKEVIEGIHETLLLGPLNPSSSHSSGQKAKQLLIQSRARIALYFGIDPLTIYFTSSATEGINTLLKSFSSTPGEIVTSSIEHACIEKTLQSMEKRGKKVKRIPATKEGSVSVEEVEKILSPETEVVILGSANSETGVRIELEGIANLLHRKNIFFILDLVGHLGRAPFTLYPGISALVLSSHKIHGPVGVGAILYLDPKLPFSPLLLGGGQEFHKRAGTEPLALIVGFSRAIELLQDVCFEKIAKKRDLLESLLAPLSERNGSSFRICNTSNLYFPSLSGEELFIQLDLCGIETSLGSACSSGALEPSRVLTKMGFERKRVLSSLRFSLSRYTSEKEIIQTVEQIKQINAQFEPRQNAF